MDGNDSFWLALHHLSRHYLTEGLTPAERADAIAEQFLKMPAVARRELLDDLWPLATNLADLYTVMLSLHRKTEYRESTVAKVG